MECSGYKDVLCQLPHYYHDFTKPEIENCCVASQQYRNLFEYGKYTVRQDRFAVIHSRTDEAEG